MASPAGTAEASLEAVRTAACWQASAAASAKPGKSGTAAWESLHYLQETAT